MLFIPGDRIWLCQNRPVSRHVNDGAVEIVRKLNVLKVVFQRNGFLRSRNTDAIADAVAPLQTQINARATVTALNTVATDASSALAEGLDDVRAEFAAADAGLQTQINSKASVTQLNTAITTEEQARADAINLVRADFLAADAGLQTQINTKASTGYVDTAVANETTARSTALATRDASFRRLAWGTGPVNVADAAFFTGARAGDPQTVADLGGDEVAVSGSLGRVRRLTWVTAGNNALTKAIFPIIPGRIWRVRISFRVSTLPSDGVANLSAITAGIVPASAFENPASSFAPQIAVSNTGAQFLEYTIGDNTTVADVAYPASGSSHFRVGLRQNASETTIVDIATIEVDDVTLERGLAADITSKASQSQLALVEANANAAISALNTSLSAEIDGVQGEVNILQGVLATPGGAEAVVGFSVNTGGGIAGLKIISTSGTLSPGTKIIFDANWTTINGNAVVNGSLTANKLAVSQLSAITANVGLLRTASSGARMEIEANQLRAYDASGVLRVRLGIW